MCLLLRPAEMKLSQKCKDFRTSQKTPGFRALGNVCYTYALLPIIYYAGLPSPRPPRLTSMIPSIHGAISC